MANSVEISVDPHPFGHFTPQADIDIANSRLEEQKEARAKNEAGPAGRCKRKFLSGNFRNLHPLIRPRRRAGTFVPSYNQAPMEGYSPRRSMRYRSFTSTSMQLLGFLLFNQKQRSGLILQPAPPVHPKEKDILTPIPLELAYS